MSNTDALASIEAILNEVGPAAEHVTEDGDVVTADAVTEAALSVPGWQVPAGPVITYDPVMGAVDAHAYQDGEGRIVPVAQPEIEPAEVTEDEPADEDDAELREQIINEQMNSPEGRQGTADWQRELEQRRREQQAKEEAMARAGEMRDYLARYLVFPEATRDASLDLLTLWALATYSHKIVGVSPRLAIVAPTKGSGKTTVMEVLSTLVTNPSPMGVTPTAPVIKLMAAEGMVMFLDEVDTLTKGAAGGDIAAVLNSGYKAGGAVMRVGRTKGGQFLDKTSTFAPVCFAGIAHEGSLPLPAATMDRAITVRIAKARPGELTTRFRVDVMRDDDESVSLRDWAQSWTNANRRQIRDARPEMPEMSSSRAEQIWEPLFIVAGILGPEWIERARQAAAVIDGETEQTADPNILFVSDLRAALDAWKGTDGNRIQVADLHMLWLRLDERKHAEALDLNRFSRKLAAFGIKSVPDKGKRWVRITDAAGEYVPVLAEVFARYAE
jgi:hypothetical protein